jgi:hypothetical protein
MPLFHAYYYSLPSNVVLFGHTCFALD